MSQPPEWSDPDPRQPSPFEQPPPQYGTPPVGPSREAFAGFWIRFAGALIDGILLSVVGSILGFALPDAATGPFAGPYSLLALAVGAAYFGYLHSTKAGQTIGQLVCGIRLVNSTDGGQVSVGAALGRWAMSYVSGFALLIGYLWMLWDPNKQTWHDKVASTYVVRASHYPAPAQFGQR